MKANNGKLCFLIYLIIIMLIFQPTIAQPLPPSKHILSYEEFVSSNAYAGEFVSVNAKVDRIEISNELDWYRIRLLSLEGKKLLNKGIVLVNHSVGLEIFEGKVLTRDEDIGIVIGKGDNIVIVGKADKIVGMNREMHVNEEGAVILLLSEEEYKKERSVRGGKMVRDFSFNFNIVESYEIIDGDLKINKRVVTKKFFALGDYNLSLLAGNYELLDGDGDGLMSPLDPFPDTKDKDGDGLDDKEEMELRTYPQIKDSDRDELSDYEEVKGTTGYITNPISKDTDGDELTDNEELFGFVVGGITYKTNPLKRDTDGDKKIDSVDPDPAPIDKDEDGLSDLEELKIGTDINRNDTDGDELTDFEEVRGTIGYKTNPLKKDTDGDGLSDKEEVDVGLNPLNQDTDGDGLSDKEELEKGTDPKNPDTDGDGIKDVNDKFPIDWDNDGWTDAYEREVGTDPYNQDTDRDGINDSEDSFPTINNNLIYGLSCVPVVVILFLSIIHIKIGVTPNRRERIKEEREKIEEVKKKILELAEEKKGYIFLKEVADKLNIDSKMAKSYMKKLVGMKIRKNDKKDAYIFPIIARKYEK